METDYINRDVAIREIIAGDWIEKIIKNQCTVRDMIAAIPAAAVVEKTEWDKLMSLVDAANKILECVDKVLNKISGVTHWMSLPQPPKEGGGTL